ncbi:MAG TPA: tetratricopeptide repeat protein, partial [Pyrinomonadaceae bacterium]|nr:tetratricopeptide repeat protein [Pyrinomonadaceae bacterium]
MVALGVGVSSGNGDTAGRGPVTVASAGEVRVLAPGEVVQRGMEAGAKHVYELALAEGQFARVFVEQRGVDVGVKVSAPGESLLIDMDSPNGFYGLEAVSVLARAAGSYSVEVYSDSSYPPGDYELRVEGPRAASASDEKRVTAERVFVEAQALRGRAGRLQGEEAAETYAAAIRKYEESHGIWLELGDLRGQGYSLSGIGRSHKAQKRLAPALAHLSQSLARLREAGDVSGQAFVLNETGAAHRDLGDLREAVASYETALPLRIALGDRWGQAQLYNNLGLGYSLIGYQPKALENYEKALPLWRALGMRHNEMNTLVNAAKARAEMGDLDAALAQYQEVLAYCDAELARDDSPLKGSATTLKPYALNGVGLVYDTWVDVEAALLHYRQSLELFRVNKDARGEADVLDNLGTTHSFLGDPTQALEYFREALALRERLNQPKGWGVTLSNIGYAHSLLGDNKEALRQLALALPLSERSRDRRFEAYTLFRMGVAHVALNDPRGALERYERALAIQREKDFADRRGQAMTLDKIGEALALAGEPAQALARYGQALELWKSVGDGQGQALSLYGMARVERDRSNLANARDLIEEALRIVESLRNRVTARQLRMTYFAGKQDFYALAIDVRMRLYELTKSPAEAEAALAASERGRARALLDLLAEARTGPHKKLSPADAEKNHRLEREISELTQTLLRLRSQGAKAGVATVEQKVAARIKEQEELLGPTRRSVAGARALAPREIQRLLDADTVLLHYSLGAARSHLWAVTRADIKHYFLPGRAEVEQTADRLRRALTAYEPRKPSESVAQYLARWRDAPEQFRRSASELSRMVLGEVWPRLGDKRLVVVPDGALHYIPFEALPSPPAAEQVGTNPALLLQRNEVVYQPSASTLAMLRGARQSVASKTVAVLA